MKTIREALIDEILYPIPEGKVNNILIARELDGDAPFIAAVAKSDVYRGCFADCLVALVQATSFSESDKSVSAMSDEVKKRLMITANKIYKSIGEEEVETESQPMVYIGC